MTSLRVPIRVLAMMLSVRVAVKGMAIAEVRDMVMIAVGIAITGRAMAEIRDCHYR